MTNLTAPFAPTFRAPLPANLPGRPDPLGVRPAWTARARGWLRAATDALGPSARCDRTVDDFADLLARARDLGEVRVALVGLAGRVSGAARAELFPARIGRCSCPLASWPARAAAPPAGPSWAEHRGKDVLDGLRSRRDRPADPSLRIDLRSAGEVMASLHLTAPHRRPWSSRVARTLETLCAMAACAERGMGAPARGFEGEAAGPEGVIHGDSTLHAFLQFALAQARRRHESLALMAIEVDRLGAIRSVLGDDCGEDAVARVARAVQGALRASDVVAHLESGRLLAILPTASVGDASRIAGSVRAAIARAGVASESMPMITASIGVACFPDHAGDVATLRAVASSALTTAMALGYDRVIVHAPTAAVAS